MRCRTFNNAPTASVKSDRGGRPRWAVITSSSPPSQRASSWTQVDFPAPSPPTSAITVPPWDSRFLGVRRQSSRPRNVSMDQARRDSFMVTGGVLACARRRSCSSRRRARSEEHTSELQSHSDLVCRLLLEKKKKKQNQQE